MLQRKQECMTKTKGIPTKDTGVNINPSLTGNAGVLNGKSGGMEFQPNGEVMSSGG
jgi:hypothetical protein